LSSDHKPEIIFLIQSLARGGAERQLVILASSLAKHDYKVEIVTFRGNGVFDEELQQAGVPVVVLEKKSRWDIFFLIRLLRYLRKEKPSILHSYLTVSNLVAVVCKPFIRDTQITWGLRASNMDLTRYPWLTRFTERIERFFSPFADLIIANSRAGKQVAVSRHYPENKIMVIPNGIDTVLFSTNAEARRYLRNEWSIDDDHLLFGIVARFDPMKDHNTFFRAANLLAEKYQHVRFVCVGDGPADYQEKLHKLVNELCIQDKVIWAGARADISKVYNALDIAVSSSSYGEGFSNSVAEAMSCGLPCVVTDVGDSAWMLGECGVVVKPNDAASLANAMSGLVDLSSKERQKLGGLARKRIVSEFSIDQLTRRTEKALNLKS